MVLKLKIAVLTLLIHPKKLEVIIRKGSFIPFINLILKNVTYIKYRGY